MTACALCQQVVRSAWSWKMPNVVDVHGVPDVTTTCIQAETVTATLPQQPTPFDYLHMYFSDDIVDTIAVVS